MRAMLCLFAVTSLVVTGCEPGSSGGSGGSSMSKAVAAARDGLPLGWLAGVGAPTTEPLSVELNGKSELAGAILVEDVVADGPLGQAGVQKGDAIVAVGDTPLPIKDDATLDLVAALEQARSSGQSTVALCVLRGGAVKETELTLPQATLEDGLPLNVTRFNEGAEAALAYLEKSPPQDPETVAYWQLAQMAAGREVDAEVAAGNGAHAMSAALLADAERIGSLPDEVLVRIAEAQEAPAFAGGPSGMSGSFTVSDLSELPPEIREMVESATSGGGGGGGNGGVQMMVMSSDDGPGEMDLDSLREQMGLPEDAEISVSTSFIGGPGGPGEMSMPGGSVMMAEVDLQPILQELDAERLPQLEALQARIEALIDVQRDDGSWGADDARLRATSDALAALGAAQRVGATLPNETVEKGVSWLREAVKEGKLAAAVARGADRRVEWVRAAHAVRALRSLGCQEEDELLTRLERFLGTADAKAFTSGEDLLSHALLARADGISTWQKFYDDARCQLVLAQGPDGRFSFGGDAARDTAIGALVLALQHERTPVLIGTAENPAIAGIDGHGKRPMPEMPDFDMPAGGNVQMITDPGEVRKIMTRMGVGPDGSVEMDVNAEVIQRDGEDDD